MPFLPFSSLTLRSTTLLSVALAGQLESTCSLIVTLESVTYVASGLQFFSPVQMPWVSVICYWQTLCCWVCLCMSDWFQGLAALCQSRTASCCPALCWKSEQSCQSREQPSGRLVRSRGLLSLYLADKSSFLKLSIAKLRAC